MLPEREICESLLGVKVSSIGCDGALRYGIVRKHYPEVGPSLVELARYCSGKRKDRPKSGMCLIEFSPNRREYVSEDLLTAANGATSEEE